MQTLRLWLFQTTFPEDRISYLNNDYNLGLHDFSCTCLITDLGLVSHKLGQYYYFLYLSSTIRTVLNAVQLLPNICSGEGLQFKISFSSVCWRAFCMK